MSVCKGPNCRRRIYWHRTEHGKNLPLDPDPITRDEAAAADWRGVFFLDEHGRAIAAVPGDMAHSGEEIFFAHWATCPDREVFRR